jgi:hypothetical protein
MNQLRSFPRRLIEETKNSLGSSSIHSLPQLSGERHIFVKIVWLLAFFGSLGVCIWFLYTLIIDYLSNATITGVKINFLNSILFPTVVMCSLNSTYVRNTSQGLQVSSKEWISDLVHLSECKFNDIECDFNEDFYYLKDPQYGICFSFNGGKNMQGKTVDMKSVNNR